MKGVGRVHSGAGAILLSWIAAAGPASAEVMDKMPAVGEIWSVTLPMAACALALGFCHPLCGVFLPLPMLYPFGILTEVLDLQTAIRAEAGSGYIVRAHLAFWSVPTSYLVGLLFYEGRRRRRCKVA